MSEVLEVDGISLRGLAFGAATRNGRYGVPSKRGENLIVPGSSGSVFVKNKPYEEGVGALSLWAVGAISTNTGGMVEGETEIRNYAANPKFATQALLYEQFRNLWVNPSFEKASNAGTEERSRNYYKRSSMTSTDGTSNYAGGGSNVNSVAIVTVPYAKSGRAARVTWTTKSTAAGDVGVTVSAGATAGLTTAGILTVEYKFRALVNSTWDAPIVYASAGVATVLARSRTVSKTFVAGETESVWVTASYDATAFAATIKAMMNNAQTILVGADVYDVIVYPGHYKNVPYFDGAGSNILGYGPFFTASWAGTADNSAAICTGPTASTVFATNLVPNPNSETTAFAPEGGGSATISLSTTQKFGGVQSTKVEWISGSRGVGLGTALTVLPNTLYQCSVYVFRESGAAPPLYVTDGSYLAVQSIAIGGAIGTWVRYNIAYTTGAAQTTLRMYTLGNAAQTYYVDAWSVTRSDVLYPYFDGTYVVPGEKWDSLDFKPKWTGTVNGSTSTLCYSTPENTQGSSAMGLVQSIEDWAPDRGCSMRIVPTGTTNDTYGLIGGSSSTAMNCGLAAGRRYTMRAVSRLAAPQTGSALVYSLARKIVVYWNNVAGFTGVQSIVSPVQAPNVAGTYEHIFRFQIPSNAVWAFIRVYCGGAFGEGDVSWEDISVMETESDMGYFDGTGYEEPGSVIANTPELGNIVWAGTAHASESKIQAYVPTKVGAVPTSTFLPPRYWKSAGGLTVLNHSATSDGYVIVSQAALVDLPGKKWTFSMDVTPSIALPVVHLRIYGVKNGVNTDQHFASPPLVAGKNRVTYNADLTEFSSIGFVSYQCNYSAATNGNNPFTITYGNVFAREGTFTQLNYLDGDSENWTWDGVVGDSSSRGAGYAEMTYPNSYEESRQYLESNIAKVMRFFTRGHRLSTIRAAQPDGSIRRAQVEWREWSEPDVHAGGTRAEWAVAYTIPSTWWEDEATTTQNSTAGAVLPKTLDLTSFADMTGVIEDATLTVAGPIVNPRITDSETGAWIQYNGSVPSGQSWVIDCAAFTSKVNGVSVMSATVHTGGYKLFVIPNCYQLTDTPRLVLSGTVPGALTQFGVTARRKYAIG